MSGINLNDSLKLNKLLSTGKYLLCVPSEPQLRLSYEKQKWKVHIDETTPYFDGQQHVQSDEVMTMQISDLISV